MRYVVVSLIAFALAFLDACNGGPCCPIDIGALGLYKVLGNSYKATLWPRYEWVCPIGCDQGAAVYFNVPFANKDGPCAPDESSSNFELTVKNVTENKTYLAKPGPDDRGTHPGFFRRHPPKGLLTPVNPPGDKAVIQLRASSHDSDCPPLVAETTIRVVRTPPPGSPLAAYSKRRLCFQLKDGEIWDSQALVDNSYVFKTHLFGPGVLIHAVGNPHDFQLNISKDGGGIVSVPPKSVYDGSVLQGKPADGSWVIELPPGKSKELIDLHGNDYQVCIDVYMTCNCP